MSYMMTFNFFACIRLDMMEQAWNPRHLFKEGLLGL